MISTAIIAALNAHAIACLHVNAGQYRPCQVTVGDYTPPEYYRVPELMNAFIDEVNHAWLHTDSVALAAHVLWRLNSIHPFINGNGRTARALCYFVICVNAEGMLSGKTTLPELIRRDHDEYVKHLKDADQKAAAGDQTAVAGLHAFLVRLLNEQLASAADGE